MHIAPKAGQNTQHSISFLSFVYSFLSNSISFLSCFSLLSLICLSICCFTKVPEFTSIFQFLFLFYYSTIHVSLFLRLNSAKSVLIYFLFQFLYFICTIYSVFPLFYLPLFTMHLILSHSL